MKQAEFIEALPSDTGYDLKLIGRAFAMAEEAHRGQIRKFSGVPYVIHPIRVALQLKDYSEDLIIAGLLHDVVEDTSVTLDEITKVFGSHVALLVEGLTKTKDNDRVGPLRKAMKHDQQVLLVKLADRFDNISDEFDKLSVATRQRYIDETPEILELAESIDISFLVEDIRNRLSELQDHSN